MDESSLWLALVFILGIGAIGIYLLLPAEHPQTASGLKWFGAPLAIIALVLLAALLRVPAKWWPELAGVPHVPRLFFAIPAIASVVTAALAVTSRNVQRGVLWFGGLLLSNSLLFLLHGAYLLAMATVMLLALAAAGCWALGLLPLTPTHHKRDAEPVKSHEPFLACLTGGLLAVVLIGTIVSATGGMGVSDVERLAGLMTRKSEAVLAERSQTNDSDWISGNQTHFRGFVRSLVREHRVAASAIAFLFVLALVAAPLIGRRSAAEFEAAAETARVET